MADELNKKILEFLQQKSLESSKKVDSAEIIRQLNISEIQLRGSLQSLKDQKFIDVLNRTGYSSLVNINSDGRMFLNSVEKSPEQNASNGPTFVFNGPIENIGTVGTSHGDTHQADNRTTKIIQELESVKSIVKEKETDSSVVSILLEKINDLQNESKQSHPSQSKIDSILTSMSSVASWIMPVVSLILKS